MDTDDPYWLFYYPLQLSQFGILQASSLISGYWLVGTNKEHEYRLLVSKEKATIRATSIVKCDENDQASYLFLHKKILLEEKISQWNFTTASFST